MSRIGKKPIPVPRGVEVTIAEGNLVTIKGPKGTLTQQLSPEMIIKHENGIITVARPSDAKHHRALHGLTRSLIANMVTGVTEGYQRTLEITGIGYRAAREGKNLILQLGFSHPIRVTPPEGITFEVMERRSANEPQYVIVRGIDKQKVGEEAAKLRALRPPDPYKGYGIKYRDERVRRKAGKTGKAR
ncbi:MAG: 50S ribosomal protein L6 [Roseiflexus sp.]|nr:50S ribosomal protein L6 [Roseiflexus sp.]MCS7291170.1 50S ribosomal protein L6 [Roseiflexus sp.]MDW8147798.1 50S ribosomal protein L6 [Roseiflexaceae bacterium]MDW8232423.1 50S ribosomal protein L6 [Roseiflexaceae bacterium]